MDVPRLAAFETFWHDARAGLAGRGPSMKQFAPLLLLVASLTACGGGGEAEPTATATPATAAHATETVEDRAATEALLKAAALRVEDLPSGFTLDGEVFTTNEEEAGEGNAYGGPTLEDLNRWGQILTYEVSYSRETPNTLSGAALSFYVATTVYRESKGARDNFEFIRRQASDPELIKALQQEFATSSGLDVRDASMSPMSFAKVGDDRMAFEVTFTAHNADSDTDLDFITQFIHIRRGRGIGSIVVTALGSSSPVGELEDLTRKFDERMKDALE